MDDLEKRYGTSSILRQTLCIISNPLVNSNWSYSPETLNSGRNWRYFILCDLEIWWMTLENNRAPLLYHFKLCASFQKHRWSRTWVTVRKCSIRVEIGNFFYPCDLEIWQMTLKNNRTPLLCPVKICASFHSHWWIQTGVSVRKHSTWVKINGFFIHVTSKFDEWPWKTIEHLFYTALSFVHHFKAMSEFNLELQSGNAQSGSKLAIFCPVQPWNLTNPLENNRVPLLFCFKRCASFHSHWWI